MRGIQLHGACASHRSHVTSDAKCSVSRAIQCNPLRPTAEELCASEVGLRFYQSGFENTPTISSCWFEIDTSVHLQP